MNTEVEYILDKASVAEIIKHLQECDAEFVPTLSSRVDISNYAQKIVGNAKRFEAWSDRILIGLIAVYCNDLEKRIAYVTSVSVIKEHMGKGVASSLMHQCIKHMNDLGMSQISLEVASDNPSAIRLYEKCGFTSGNVSGPFITMNLYLEIGEKYEQ